MPKDRTPGNGHAHMNAGHETRESLWALHQKFDEMGLRPMWHIYEPPVVGFAPDCYVARMIRTEPDVVVTPYTMKHADLDALRGMMPPTCANIGRSPDDPPHLLEVWV